MSNAWQSPASRHGAALRVRFVFSQQKLLSRCQTLLLLSEYEPECTESIGVNQNFVGFCVINTAVSYVALKDIPTSDTALFVYF